MGNFDKQQWGIIAGILLFTAGIGIVRVIPLLQQRQVLAQSIGQQHQTLEEIQTQGLRLTSLAEQLEYMELQSAVFDARIPTGRGFADLWQQIADLMNQCNLSDQHVQPGQAIEGERLGAIPLTLSATGTTHDFFDFFRAIEQWDRLIRFERVELTNDSAFDGRASLNAIATLYYQIEQKQG